ncbi:hypothetical protein [Brucella intermedia]
MGFDDVARASAGIRARLDGAKADGQAFQPPPRISSSASRTRASLPST